MCDISYRYISNIISNKIYIQYVFILLPLHRSARLSPPLARIQPLIQTPPLTHWKQLLLLIRSARLTPRLIQTPPVTHWKQLPLLIRCARMMPRLVQTPPLAYWEQLLLRIRSARMTPSLVQTPPPSRSRFPRRRVAALRRKRLANPLTT